MYFRLSGQFDTYGVNHQRAVTSGIRYALAKAGKVSELRVSSILVCCYFIVFATLLDVPKSSDKKEIDDLLGTAPH